MDPGPGTGDTEIWVDGRRVYRTGAGCPGGLVLDSDLDLGDLTVGAPLTVTLKATSGPVALTVGELLSVSSYKFPPRPATLRPLDADRPADPDGDGENALAVRADPADPNRPVTVMGIWRGQKRISLVTQTPGRLSLTVANRLAAQEDWWDFDQGVRTTAYDGRFLEDGEPFPVTVTPEGMSGDWLVRLER
ncbi:hypothetical protein [Spirilliplanes yamanashiensis]|uniref:Uncharacterized protein n=1 Tax=Spirilliplanes yamanashiensis TaxID=42233 RepID=A0A8J3Y6G2_9ACTN|nr:hypothetical protein [Spirilliplanes yamanashiensis]MDP9814533.1 hypothetical protein [Spirilliplanes yamanashiensis]GIJ02185.1 hypothetical protein Sya03_15370 [Spirilliplanes yamanashiensis]